MTLETIAPADYERPKYMGSADIAGVLGISPWQTPVDVYVKKTQPYEPPVGMAKRKLFRRGRVFEAVVAEMTVAELEGRGHTVKVLGGNQRYKHPDFPYMASEIDLEIQLDDIPGTVNVEIKTVHAMAAGKWGESESQDYPLHYAAQAQYGLGVTGRQCCILAPLFGADELRIYPIVRDQPTIDAMILRTRLFWENHVQKGIPPEPQPGNVADLTKLFGRDTGEIKIVDGDIEQKLVRYHACKLEIAAREAEQQLLEYDIKKFMGTAQILRFEGQDKNAVVWKNNKDSKYFDASRFKEANPKLYREFERVRTGVRPFKVNQIKIGGSHEFDSDDE